MIAINKEMPKGCQRCVFFRKHMFGNGLDYSYSCALGGTEFPMPWIRQMEERASDCFLTEIVTCKDCEHKVFLASDSKGNTTYMCDKHCKNITDEDFYCRDGERKK